MVVEASERWPYRISDHELAELLHLEPHGPETFVGSGPEYPWGGLYGGQVLAQALRAPALTLPDSPMQPHSLRTYFIHAGDHTEPVRYEVDRLRQSHSFARRRVVARQVHGAILNLDASFTTRTDEPTWSRSVMPEVPGPGESLADFDTQWFAVSLDHTVWFHEVVSPDVWHLYSFSCDRRIGERCLTSGRVFARDGRHVATVAQEMLVRRRR